MKLHRAGQIAKIVFCLSLIVVVAFPSQVKAAEASQSQIPAGDSITTPNNLPDSTRSIAGPVYSISHCGNTGSRVLLTYDDWSYNNPTRIVTQAKLLRSKNVGAMFFPIRQEYIKYLNSTGDNLPYKTRDEGQYNGNHTWSHQDLVTLSSTSIKYQIANGAGGKTGTSGYLRPPYGSYNTNVKTIAESMNYHVCTWTVDTEDWKGKTAASICSYVKANVRPGSVVLMHLHTNSYYATSCIVDGIRAKGLQICRPYTVNGVVKHTPIRAPYPLPC